MKKIYTLMLVMFFAASAMMAQTDREIRKERQEVRKMAKAELTARVDRNTRKEAKRLKEEGWQVKPGALPLEKQLERSYLMQFEYDEDLFPKYIMGEASSVGENYDAAKASAMSLALTNLAGQMKTEVTALVENSVTNRQLAPGEAESISESVIESKNLISQSIERTILVVECFRINEANNNEVLVRLAYNSDLAKEATKQAMRAELEEKGRDLHNKLEKMMGW
jgi:hypothetical protein